MAGHAEYPLAIDMAHICIHRALSTVERKEKGTAVTQQGSMVHAEPVEVKSVMPKMQGLSPCTHLFHNAKHWTY